MQDNPLLYFAQKNGFPPFDRFHPSQVQAAIEELLTSARTALNQVTQDAFLTDWATISRTLDVPLENLERGWGVVTHLNAVADNPTLRVAYKHMLPLVSTFWAELASHEKLFTKYQKVRVDPLTHPQQQALKNTLRDFELGGASLRGSNKERFRQIQERLTQLSQSFSENVLDATDHFSYYASQEEVGGLPDDVLELTRLAAAKDNKTGFKLSLKAPVYLPVMQFAHNRGLREKFYRAYVTRASDLGSKPQWDNTTIIQEILALRTEAAHLLGFSHYAALSLAPKMAQNVEEVTTFLRDLATCAKPFAQRDLAQMRSYALHHMGIQDPQPWDWPYISERLREKDFAINEQEIKKYFNLPKVLEGLFVLVEHLFNIQIVKDQVSVWHPNVSFYKITRNKKTLAYFYLDPTARVGKRGGAWMDSARSRWLRPDTKSLQLPIAYLVCNFSEGLGDKPALLTHDDVITLFHEFGHGLHHMLTQIDELAITGIHGVEWDAVELPSQFMENFCWEPRVLRTISAHIDSGETIPESLIEKLRQSKNFQAGLQTLRQIEFALFDMSLHTQIKPDFVATLQTVQQEVAVIHPPQYYRMAHSFSHIFAGGYAAGYYSYKWAEVLSADAYASFKDTTSSPSGFDKKISQSFLKNILEVGASRPALESFQAFKGRPPQIQALLDQEGMSV